MHVAQLMKVGVGGVYTLLTVSWELRLGKLVVH
jgi:hypothetical protein